LRRNKMTLDMALRILRRMMATTHGRLARYIIIKKSFRNAQA
jgi:hypothetical protein